jgi:hypothetical protein
MRCHHCGRRLLVGFFCACVSLQELAQPLDLPHVHPACAVAGDDTDHDRWVDQQCNDQQRDIVARAIVLRAF